MTATRDYDPRWEALSDALGAASERFVDTDETLARTDAADLAAGVIRIDTNAGPHDLCRRIFPEWEQLPVETKAFLVRQTDSWLMLLLGVTIRESEDARQP